MAKESDDLSARLAKRCRSVRDRKKLSLMDVFNATGVSISHVQKIERGVLNPRLSTLAKLAKAYDMTLSALLRGV